MIQSIILRNFQGCECGCGMLVRFKWGSTELNRFVHGHNFKFKYHTEESKQKTREKMIGNKNSLGFKHSEETKQKMLGNKRGVGHKHTEDWKKNKAEFMMGRKHGLGYKHTEVEKQKMRGRKHTEEWKENQSEIHKELWADPVYHKVASSRMAVASATMRPNRKETQLLNLLESIQPSDWKYVGDGSFIIAGKNPDFINVNGKKLIIELFGDYWHQGQNPQDRIDVFKPFGFSTLVIWEHELKNELKVVNRVRRFVLS